MKIEYSRQAIDDLSRIEDYYAERTIHELAQSLIEQIKKTLERLIARHSRIGRLRSEFGPQVRSFPVVPHVVFYKLARQDVYVLRILHGHRDIKPPLMSLLLAS